MISSEFNPKGVSYRPTLLQLALLALLNSMVCDISYMVRYTLSATFSSFEVK